MCIINLDKYYIFSGQQADYQSKVRNPEFFFPVNITIFPTEDNIRQWKEVKKASTNVQVSHDTVTKGS